ncbi:MAG: hypothetical protein IKP79_00895 [Bacilli bacterium]|nr:hypothetical protein [Bacilli bacterium]
MFFKKKNKLFNIMTLIQNVLACITIVMAFVNLFDNLLSTELNIMLSLFLLVFGFNNYKFYKLKYLTVVSFILSILLILGVIF